MSPGQCFYTDQSTRSSKAQDGYNQDGPNVARCSTHKYRQVLWSFNIYDGRKKTAPTKIKTPANELEFYQGK